MNLKKLRCSCEYIRMKKTVLTFFIILSIPAIGISQNLPKDTLLGNVKKVREKVIFLTEKENPQMLYYDDYGHSGFRGPELTMSHFQNVWYYGKFCSYINYERHFDEQKKVSKETWFGKKDNFIKSYSYIYDKKNRLIRTVDSSEYSIETTNHYFLENRDFIFENIITENLEDNMFSYCHNTYKNGKIILTKYIDEHGIIDEYTNHYDEKGKLTHQTYKVPYRWKKVYDNTQSSGIQDSINMTYKNLVNEYDLEGRLIKTQRFELSSEEGYKPSMYDEKTYNYKRKNLAMTGEVNKDYQSYKHYRYDESNRIIGQYCCDKDVSKSKMVQKYTYKDGRIATLNYSEAGSSHEKAQKHKISYTYKFDDTKNWTEIIKTVDGKDLYKWIREIEYY